MKLSARYYVLKGQLRSLENVFLNFPDADSPSPNNQNKLRAFQVLSHAELEDYLEFIAQECFDYATDIFKSQTKLHPILLNIVLFSGVSFSGNKNMSPVKEMMGRVIANFQSTINSNNGVREDNILKLFVPLGMTPDCFDSTWLATIDSFGQKRGSIAHKSSAITKALYKPDVLNNIKIILQGVKSLDKKVGSLKVLKGYPLSLL